VSNIFLKIAYEKNGVFLRKLKNAGVSKQQIKIFEKSA